MRGEMEHRIAIHLSLDLRFCRLLTEQDECVGEQFSNRFGFFALWLLLTDIYVSQLRAPCLDEGRQSGVAEGKPEHLAARLGGEGEQEGLLLIHDRPL